MALNLAGLKTAMFVTMALVFGTIAAIFGFILYAYSRQLSIISGVTLILAFSIGFTFLQWWFGPVFIKMITNMRELKQHDYPEIWEIARELSHKAGIPMPKLYLVNDATPNAFAFGRTPKDSNIALHAGLLNMLNKEEVKAVMAHEMGHIRHWDVAVITLASMLPMLVYYAIVFFGGRSDDDRGAGNFVLVWIGAIIAQMLSQLLVMYLSRVRESYADAFAAVALGKTQPLQTALAKISYGFSMVNASAYASKRAFYIADPQAATQLSMHLNQGKLEKELEHSYQGEGFRLKPEELKHAIEWEKKKGGIIEIFSTHPRTYKRIERLDEIQNDIQNGRLGLKDI